MEYRTQPVDRPEQAQIVVAGSDFQTTRPTGLWLKVAAPVRVGEVNQFSLDEIRLYLLSNAPYAAPLKLGPETLSGARAAFGRLKEYIRRFQSEEQQALPNLSKDPVIVAEWRDSFYVLVCDDEPAPRALATLWMLLQSDLPDPSKLALLTDFASVLGLSQGLGLPESFTRPPLEPKRPAIMKQPPSTADRRPGGPSVPNRSQAVVTGFEGRSKPPLTGSGKAAPGKLPEKSAREITSTEQPPVRRINRSQDVRSYLREPDRYDFTISLIAYNNLAAVQTTVDSLLKIMPRCARSLEVIVAEMNSSDKTADYLAATVRGYANFRVVYAQQNLGEAAGRNIAFRQGRGRYLLLLDAGLRLTGAYFEELWQELALAEAVRPALYWAFPVKLVRQADALTGFEAVDLDLEPATGLEVEALEGSALCFRRGLIEEAGFMDEHFRLPYGLGLD
jgi:hypothetical protein